MSVQPTEFIRRSPLYRELVRLGANFGEVNRAATALDFGDSAGELAQAREMGIADAFTLKRWGLKGWNTAPWLREHGCSVGEEPNIAYRQSDGSLIAMLAWGEALILGDIAGESVSDRLQRDYQLTHGIGTYPIPRPSTNCWFILSGRHAAEMYSKICGVDVHPRAFANFSIAQTSVARLNSIVIRADLGTTLAYHMLTDSASAEYMWGCLLDAMAEFGGKPVGLSALRRLAAS